MACNFKFSLSFLQPSDITSHSQDPYHSSSVLHPWEVFPVNALFFFCAVRCLKLWNRSTMTEERLSGLEMLIIHHETNYVRNLRSDSFTQ